MPTFDEVSAFDSVHAKNVDGSILTAIRIPADGKRRNEWPWIVLEGDSDGTPVKDTITTLVDENGHAMYRKLYSTDELRTHWEGAEWNKGYFFPKPPPSTEPVITPMFETVPSPVPSTPITDEVPNVRKPEDTKEPSEDSMEPPIKQRRQQKRLTPEEIANQINEVAASIAERSPSYTQQIIAEQVQLGGTYYSQVATQSQQSFDLARLLTVIGAILFVTSMVVMIIPFANGNTTVVGSLGVIVAGIVEAVAGLSFLYNKA